MRGSNIVMYTIIIIYTETGTGISRFMRFCGSTLLFCIVLLLSPGPRSSFVVGDGDFTQFPRKINYKERGEKVTFGWDYTVENKMLDFSSLSPRWSFFNASGDEWKIGHENRVKNWAWEITPDTCPSRLLIPTVRVSKTARATLEIHNLTTADSGTYGCTLVLSPPKTSKVELIVTVRPNIYSYDTVNVTEHGNLSVNCTATGPPTPNVTWIKRNVELAFGQNGGAVLRIYNITRNESGIYNCNATNNPEKRSETKPTTVNVEYPIEFDEGLSSTSVEACLGKKNVELKSVARGNPIPMHYWLSPDKSKSQTDSVEKSIFLIKEVEEMDFGNWTVNITNGIRSFYYLHSIEVKKGVYIDGCGSSSGGKEGLSTAEKVGIGLGVLAPVVIAATAGGIYYYKKKKGPNPAG